jgi:hypothetical protein
MERNPAGATNAAASEVNDFMEAMGAGSAPAPSTPEITQAPPVAPAESQPPVVDTQVSSAPEAQPLPPMEQGIPERPVAAESEVTPPADNSQAELDRFRREAEIARQQADTYRQQVEQYNAAMQAEMARAQQRQIDQQRAERVNQAMQIHNQLVDSGQPEKAADYIRSFYDQILVSERQASQATIANLRVQQQQEAHRLLAPQYAADLVRQHGLPQEYVGVLSQFDGYTQDRMVTGLKAQYEAQRQQLARRETELEQRVRELEASQRAASGAFNPGGTNGSSSPSTGTRPSDPRAAEVFDYLQSPVIPR